MTSSCMRLPPMTQSTGEVARACRRGRACASSARPPFCVIHASDDVPVKCAPAKLPTTERASALASARACHDACQPARFLAWHSRHAAAPTNPSRVIAGALAAASATLASSFGATVFPSLGAFVRDVHAAVVSSTAMHTRPRIFDDDASSARAQRRGQCMLTASSKPRGIATQRRYGVSQFAAIATRAWEQSTPHHRAQPDRAALTDGNQDVCILVVRKPISRWMNATRSPLPTRAPISRLERRPGMPRRSIFS